MCVFVYNVLFQRLKENSICLLRYYVLSYDEPYNVIVTYICDLMMYLLFLTFTLFHQVLPIFPRLVDLPLDKFQTALANILQVRTKGYYFLLICFTEISSCM